MTVFAVEKILLKAGAFDQGGDGMLQGLRGLKTDLATK